MVGGSTQVCQSINKVYLSIAFICEKLSKGQQGNLPFTTYNEQPSHLRLVHNNDIMSAKLPTSQCKHRHKDGKGSVFLPYMSLCSCYMYVAIMSGCSHYKHNDITSFLCHCVNVITSVV